MSEAGPFVVLEGPNDNRKSELSPSERGRALDELCRLTNALVNAQHRLRQARQECDTARIQLEVATRRMLGAELTREDQWLER